MIVEIDGQTYEVPDDATEAEISALLGAEEITLAPSQMAPPEDNSHLGYAAAGLEAGRRAVPGIVHAGARFVANHPAGVQKAIGAGISGLAGTMGAAVGSGFGPAGAMVGGVTGAGVRGVTPTQAAIREAAGRLAGEAPAIARTAGRAAGVANYGKEMGLKVNPNSLISTGDAARAFDNYADAQGLKAPRVLDSYGKVVYGPEAVPKPKAPGIVSRLAGKLGPAAKFATGPAMSALLASTEVNRHLNSPEVIADVNELQLPAEERTNQMPNPERDRILARMAALLGM